MKKLILILCIILSGLIYSQSKDTLIIYYGLPGDSVRYVSTGLDVDLIKVAFKPDTNTTNKDSIKIESGIINTDDADNTIDITWHLVSAKSDSLLGTVVTLINDGNGAGFTITDYSGDILRFTLLNYRGLNTVRKVLASIILRER